MNKKWSISITIAVVAVIYAFLLIGMPALEDKILPCGNGDLVATTDNNSFLVDKAAYTGPSPDLRPYREIFKAPLIIYFLPGVIGVFAIVVILKREKKTKDDSLDKKK